MSHYEPRRSKRRVAREDEPPRQRRRHLKWMVPCLLLLAVLVFLAPMLATRLPFLDKTVGRILGINGSVHIEAGSVGWLSPVVINHVEVRDVKGTPVLTTDAVRSERSLLGLLCNFHHLGQFRIEHPVVRIEMGKDSSNLEEVLAPLWQSESSGGQCAFGLEVDNATVDLKDTVTGQEFTINGMTCKLTSDPAAGKPCDADVRGLLHYDGRQSEFSTVVHIDQKTNAGQHDAAVATGAVDCHVEAFPVAALQGLVRRQLADARLNGTLSATLHGTWGAGGRADQAEVRGQVQGRQLALSATPLGTDGLSIDRLDLPCDIVRNGDVFELKQMAVDCDLGRLAATGTIKLADVKPADWLVALAHNDLNVEGTLNLAELARRLPATLRIREGTQITQGQLDLKLASHTQNKGMNWTGRLATDKLVGTANGRPLAWEQPLVVSFTAREESGEILVDQARCESSFLTVDATGTRDRLTATARFDLQRLATELERFADLNGLEIAGQGQLQLAIDRQPEERFNADGQLSADGLRITVNGQPPWREDRVTAILQAGGQTKGYELKQLERATLKFNTSVDQMEAKLLQPVNDVAAGPWPVSVQWRGQLSNWPPRLRPWVSVADWDVSGTGDFTTQVTWTPAVVEARQTKLNVQRCHVWGHGLYIDEPTLAAQADVRWRADSGRCEVPEASLTAGDVQATIVDGVWQPTQDRNPMQAGGQCQYQCELAHVDHWLHDPRLPAPWKLSGKAAGKGKITQADRTCAAQLDSTIERFSLTMASASTGQARQVPGARPDWQEQRVTLGVQAKYDEGHDQLQIDELNLASDALRCSAAGKVAELFGSGDADLRGKVEFDWAQVGPLLKPYLGDSVRIRGRESRTFALRGPVGGLGETSKADWLAVVGDASLGWDSAEVFGMTVSKGEILAKVEKGVVETQPLDLAVSGGRVHLAPQVRLAPEPAELRLPKGPLVEQLQITPEICARSLKYAAPVLADATIAEGKFSVDLDGGRLPLSDLSAGDVGGRLTIHTAQVKPGPLAESLIMVGKQIEAIIRRRPLDALEQPSGSLMTINDQQVKLRMVNRRVYHEGLKFNVGKVPITTHGYVAFDETLAILAEIPVQESWIGDNPSLAGLRNQTLKIPIEGTLKQPRLDRRGIEQLTNQLLENTARGVILDQLNKNIDKLLPLKR